jgi:hypothetical protein
MDSLIALARRLGLLFVALGMGFALAHAHPRDEIGQATYVGITQKRVTLELNITPGDTIAPAFATLIDSNHNGELSSSERADFANTVLTHLSLTINGTDLPLTLTRMEFPSGKSLQRGEERVRLFFEAPLPLILGGTRTIHYKNRYTPDGLKTGYLTATLAGDGASGTDAVKIGAQRRDAKQQTLTVDAEFPINHSPITLIALALLLSLGLSLGGVWLWQNVRPSLSKPRRLP